MLKKLAVVLLIFILMSAAPDAKDLLNDASKLFNDAGNLFVSVKQNVESFISSGSSFIAGVFPTAQASAIPSPSAAPTPTAEATPTPTPSAATTPTPAPSPSEPDLFGTINGQTYVNDAAGFQINIPDGYQANDRQAIKETIVRNSTNDAFKAAYNDPEKLNELAQSGTVPVFLASKHQYDYTAGFNSHLDVSISQMNTPLPGSILDIADIIKQSLEKMLGYTNVQGPQAVTINGTDAALITAAVGTQDINVSQKVYLLRNNGWMITVTLQSASQTELDEMTNAVQTIKIATPTVSATPSAQESADPGTISGQTYTNITGGFSLSYPAGYKAINDAAAMKKSELDSFDLIKGIYKDPDAVRQLIEKEDPPCAIAYKQSGKGNFIDELSVSMTKTDSFSGSMMDYASVIKNSMALYSDKILFKNPSVVKIAGLDGAVLQSSYRVGAYTVSENMYYFENNGYIVTVDLFAPDDADMNDLAKALGTVKITGS